MSKDIRQLTKAGVQFYPQTHIAGLVGYGQNGSAIDEEPTSGSDNLAKSGGVYDAVGFLFTRAGFLSSFGAYTESAYHKCTDLIPCHQATYKIQCNAMSSQMSVAFYDRQKVFLSGLSGSSESVTLTTFTGDVPSDCYYMVVCNVNGHLPSAPRGNVIINRIENTDEGFVVSGNKTAFSIDGYFDAAGNLHETTAWKATDYIPVRPGVPYSAVVYRQTGTSNIVFYNSSKQVLSTVIGSEGAVTAISGTVPDSAYFARFCSYNTGAAIKEAAFGFYFDFKNALGYGEDDLFGLYKNNFTGKPFSFAGKKAAFFGDSVTYGVKSDPLSRADKCYREWLCERLGLTGTNCAVSGSFICDLEDAETSILNKVLDTISSQSEYDFIFIAGGVNDYWTGKPLGTIEDSTYATFYGALNVMCDYLTQTIGNGTEVIFLTPINCTRSDLSQTTNPLDDYRNAIFRVATIHGFNVVDTSVIGFPSNIKDTYFRSQLIADGVHPTELGHKIMGLNIAAILQPDANAESERDYTYWGTLTPSTQYTNSSRILWIEDSGTKVKFAKSIKFKPVPNVATNVYKVSVDNGEATVSLIKTSANTGIVAGDIVELELGVRLEENEFIGLNRSLCYDNTGFGNFHYTYCPVEGGEVVSVADGSAIAIQYYGEIETEGPATKEVDNEFIVDINGNGHYTNPFEAMVGLKGKDTASHPITIKVMPGTYVMPTLARDDYFTYCQNRYLSIVGTDKVNCILRNDNGYYNGGSAEGNLGDNTPLKISGNVYIANLTFISTDNENASESDEFYHRSYCIHMDANAAAGSIMEVHNCRLINNHAPCIGFGIPKDVTLKITDCELESDFWNPNYGYGGAVIYGHDRGGSTSQAEEHVVIKNCTFRSSNGHAFKSYNNQSALMDCVFVNNACALPEGKGVVLDTYTSVIPPSFGNSVEAMNV